MILNNNYFFIPLSLLLSCLRLFKWARTSWRRGRSTRPDFSPANGRTLQQFTCPTARNQPRGPAPLPGLVGWPWLSTCTAEPPHSVQRPHTPASSHNKPWHSMVISTYMKPNIALTASIKTESLMPSWVHTACTVSAVKEKLNGGPKKGFLLYALNQTVLY